MPAYQDQPPVVGAVMPGSPAAQSDIQPGDRILSVAGSDVDTWEQLFIAIGTRANREVSIVLQRDGREMERTHHAGRPARTEPLRDRRHRRAA